MNVRIYPIIAACCLVGPIALGNPCSDPRRLINGHIVSLQPLIAWWSAPSGIRPLAAWRHVQGSIARDTDSGWVVLATETKAHKSQSQLLLRNPPRERLRRFEELKRQLAESERAQSATMETLRRPVCVDLNSLYLVNWPSPPITLTEYKDAKARAVDLHKRVNALRAQVEPMQDQNGSFKVDAFALDQHKSFEGLPVFDYGQPQS